MYDIIISDTAKKAFLNLEKEIQDRIVAVLERIQLQPHHYCIRLTGSNAYKLRAGDYRVILDINEQNQQIIILKIGHRKNVY